MSAHRWLWLCGSAGSASAATSLAPSAPQPPFAWKIRLTWSIWATIVAIFDHEGQMFHASFRMMELVREDGCLRG